jgi:hypothetical protein
MTYYPLTPAENMHNLWINEYGTQQVAGLSIVSALQIPMQMDLMEQSIRMLYKRQGCMRLQFTAPDKKGNVQQYFVPEDTDMGEIPTVDLSDKTREEAEAIMQEWAYHTFDGNDIPMCEFKLMHLPDGYHGIFLHMDHRLIDSSGLYVITADLYGIYAHLALGKPMPKDPADFEQLLVKELDKANNPKRREKDRKFWESQLDKYGEPLYSDIQGPGPLEKARKKHRKPELRAADIERKNLFVTVKNYYLEPEPVSRVIDFCKTNQISPTNLILLTMRTYLSKVNGGQEDITVENFLSRRSTQDEWASGGSRTITFPCRTVFSADMSFMDALKELQQLQNLTYMHANYDPELLREEMRRRYKTPKHTTYVSCYLTYQPITADAIGKGTGGIPVYFKWFANGAATKKMYLTVSHTPKGEMEFSYHYQTADLTEQDMEVLYYYMMRVMFKGIENPSITLGELMGTV